MWNNRTTGDKENPPQQGFEQLIWKIPRIRFRTTFY